MRYVDCGCKHQNVVNARLHKKVPQWIFTGAFSATQFKLYIQTKFKVYKMFLLMVYWSFLSSGVMVGSQLRRAGVKTYHLHCVI